MCLKREKRAILKFKIGTFAYKSRNRSLKERNLEKIYLISFICSHLDVTKSIGFNGFFHLNKFD